MKKSSKSKNNKVDEDADHGDAKKKALTSKRSKTKEDEDPTNTTTEKVSTAEGLSREEKANGDGKDKVEESKGKKTKKRKMIPEQYELTPKKTKIKNVFDLPGQKRPAPDERDPSRIFYETLYKQVPDCEMAQIWMMESGLLPVEEAMQVYNKKQNKTWSSPAKVVAAEKSCVVSCSSSKKKTSKATVKLKKSKKRQDRKLS